MARRLLSVGPMPTRILIVDDSAAIRSFIRVYLSFGGYEFVEAEDGERALRMLSLLPIDLVVADVNMPRVDGLKFVRQLRAHHDAVIRALPVLLLTGERAEELEREAREAGSDSFIRKPIDAEALQKEISRLLRGRSSTRKAPVGGEPPAVTPPQSSGTRRGVDEGPASPPRSSARGGRLR